MRRRFIAAMLAGTLICGCAKSDKNAILPEPKLANGGSLPRAVLKESKDTKEQTDLQNSMVSYLNGGAFEQLEAKAVEFRASEAYCPDGRWKLDSFYQGFVPESSASENEWKDRIARLETWAAKKPRSVTPRVALAHVCAIYAWQARTGLWSKEVTPHEKDEFSKRLKVARNWLDEAQFLPDKCAHWYAVAESIALGEQMEKELFAKLVEEAHQKYPRYYTIYFGQAIYLHPHFFGAEGDWETAAAQAADQLGGDEGDKLYARIVWSLNDQGAYDNIVSGSKMIWPRAQKGLQLLDAQYPKSLDVLSEFCSLTYQSGSKPETMALFDRIKGDVDLKIWGGLDNFNRARNWAYTP